MSGATQAADDIWHRSIEDLLQVIEPTREARAGSFAINLLTSAVPIGSPPKRLQQFERLQVYEVVRREQGTPKFQLRLGIIESELEADAILATVRAQYPSAAKQAADDDDRAAVVQARAARAARSAASAPAASGAPAPAPAATAAKPAAARAAAAEAPPEDCRWDLDELLPNLRDTLSPSSTGAGPRGAPRTGAGG